MNEKKIYENEMFLEERALFHGRDLVLRECVFDKGESPLKESANIELEGCSFRYKYPLWYAKDIKVKDCYWFELGRSGVWYTKNMRVEDSMVGAPKNFRRCEKLELVNVSIPDAAETLWSCKDVRMEKVVAKGDYFGMNSENLYIDGLDLYGNYCFDGAKNIEVHNSRLMSKDAFWNAENVTVYDSVICGEYLGWNSKNLTFINCTIESGQGMCYIDNLVMKNCKLLNTTLAFEYCTVEAQINGHIDSVLNPTSGTITADSIGELIIEKDKIDPDKTKITCTEGEPKVSDKINWEEV